MDVLVLLTALVVLGTAVVGLIAKLHRDVQEIHVMVNSRMNEALTRIDQLYGALEDAGVTPPESHPRGSPDA